MRSVPSRLKDALLDPQHKVLLYGTTPPRAGADEASVAGAAEKLAARVRALPLDGLVVYDIQDESGRTNVPRPFAFSGTHDPRAYARRLKELTGLPAITYKCVGEADEAAWNDWLGGTGDYGVEFLSIVGRPTSGVQHALPLSRALQLAAAHPARCTVGGGVIAERHSTQRSEAARMLAKSLEGCSYFISQTVYHAHATERLLAAYARDCRGAGVKPRRVVLTFAPVGREKTLAFLRWLGVRIAEDKQRAILEAPQPLAKSIELCCDNLRRILAHDYAREIPLGVNVESVSINRDELDASVDLFHALAAVLAEPR
jgi:5,10-methylenetetrahydrofolate reductase